MADKIVSWGGFDSKGTSGMGVTGSLSISSGSIAVSGPNSMSFSYTINDTSPTFIKMTNGGGGINTGGTIAFPYGTITGNFGGLTLTNSGGSTYSLGLGVGGDLNWTGANFNLQTSGNSSINSNGISGTSMTFKSGGSFVFNSFSGGFRDVIKFSQAGNLQVGGFTDAARLEVKGSGTTSSTTSFLVQNANASSSLTVRDDTAVIIGGSTTSNSLNFATSTQNAGQHAINYTFYTSNNFPVRLVATATGASGTGYLEVWATSSDGGTATSANSVFRFGNGSTQNPNNISYLPLSIGVTTVSGSSSGQIMSVRTDLASADLSTLTLQAGNANYVNRAGGNLILSAGAAAGTGDGTNGYIAFRVTNTTASSGVTNSTSEVARFSLGKNLLIGTTTDPGYKLHVSGSGNFTNNLTVTGSATISNILTLTPQDPLPSGVPTGSFAVSSSVPPKPYFYDGTVWNALY